MLSKHDTVINNLEGIRLMTKFSKKTNSERGESAKISKFGLFSGKVVFKGDRLLTRHERSVFIMGYINRLSGFSGGTL